MHFWRKNIIYRIYIFCFLPLSDIWLIFNFTLFGYFIVSYIKKPSFLDEHFSWSFTLFEKRVVCKCRVLGNWCCVVWVYIPSGLVLLAEWVRSLRLLSFIFFDDFAYFLTDFCFLYYFYVLVNLLLVVYIPII